MSTVKINCLYDSLFPINKVMSNPKNPNKHSPEQIDRLAEIIQYYGIRHPIIVSNQTKMVVVGHGRLAALKKLGAQEVPVVMQDFENEDQEYAFMVADNGIGNWSDLDYGLINAELPNFDPSFNIDCLGLHDFLLEPAEKFIEKDLWKEEFEKPTEDFQIKILFKTELEKKQILDLLKNPKKTEFKDGKLATIRWEDR